MILFLTLTIDLSVSWFTHSRKKYIGKFNITQTQIDHVSKIKEHIVSIRYGLNNIKPKC